MEVFEETCTAILFRTTVAMAVYAPDSGESLEMYGACISSVIKVLREGRRGGAKDFYMTCDLNVELGLMRTDEKDIEEVMKMYGPLCWQGYDKDPGGFKKTMWYGIMKEFDCKVSSAWSLCGRTREAFAHRHSSPEQKQEISQLDHIIGPMRRNYEIYIHNEGRHKIFKRVNKKWTGWKPITKE